MRTRKRLLDGEGYSATPWPLPVAILPASFSCSDISLTKMRLTWTDGTWISEASKHVVVGGIHVMPVVVCCCDGSATRVPTGRPEAYVKSSWAPWLNNVLHTIIPRGGRIASHHRRWCLVRFSAGAMACHLSSAVEVRSSLYRAAAHFYCERYLQLDIGYPCYLEK